MLALVADIEAELATVSNREVRHHLQVAPDLAAGLQGEALVDGQVVDERTADWGRVGPAGSPGGLTMTLVPYS